MPDAYAAALEKGRRFGAALALVLTMGCASGSRPLDLPPGHPADPATPGAAAPAAGGPGSPAAPPATPAEASYACPMHPEVVSPTPGRCPKCGMRLQQVRSGGGGAGR